MGSRLLGHLQHCSWCCTWLDPNNIYSRQHSEPIDFPDHGVSVSLKRGNGIFAVR